MKMHLKNILLIILISFIALAGWVFSLFHSIPEGRTGPEAEEIAERMLDAVKYDQYKKIESINWTFRGRNHHAWNKKNQTDKVSWESFEVWLDFKSNKHIVKKGGQEIPNDELIEQAIAHFYNDSFWLVAPFKIMDKGTKRKLVDLEANTGLLVSYESGGVTPGDCYLWLLDENYRPVAWRLWTSNVPIKGMEFEWADWQQHFGAWFAPTHSGPGALSIDITNLIIE